jgi:hypothetical protein
MKNISIEQINESLPSILKSIMVMLQQICNDNDNNDFVTDDIKRDDIFTGTNRFPPKIKIDAYIERCYKYFDCSSSCYVMAIIYMDRLVACYNKSEKRHNIILNSFNILRIFSTCMVIACKYLEDEVYTNEYYSEIAGVTVQKLNAFEIEFIEMVQFDIEVKPEQFIKYTEMLSN